MTIEQQLQELKNEFSTLASRYEALETVCKAMLPLIHAHPSVKSAMLLSFADAKNDAMELDGSAYVDPQTVRAAVDSWTALISAGEALIIPASKPHGPPRSPGDAP